jgi:hypothetical protein
MPNDLYNVSFAVQVSVVSGYLAYLIAYSGVRQHHTAADAVLKSFSFGIFAAATMRLGYQHPIWTPVVASLMTVVAGICWRWFGMNLWNKWMRDAGVSWADDIPTAWISITAIRKDVRPSQIVVDIEGGRTLMCDDTRLFAKAPFEPCVFGLDGSIALYVTSEYRDGNWIDHKDVSHPVDGDKLTYIPASCVKRVEIRHWTKANAKASPEAGAGLAPLVEAEGPEA